MKQNIKMIAILFVGIAIGVTINIGSFAEKGVYAVKSKVKFLIDSMPTSIGAYDINGETYINIWDLNILPVDVQRDSENKTYNIIPQTYIAFKEIDDKKYIDFEYYTSKYFKSSPIPYKDKEWMAMAPPLEAFDWSYFFESKPYTNKKDPEGGVIHIEDNKGKVICKSKYKYYKTRYGLRIAVDYYDFLKNIDLFFYAINKNESLLKNNK